MARSEETAREPRESKAASGSAERRKVTDKPVYEKPRLRRYDQIDQVKPYGPSEL